jgi:hypothetical protein
MYFSYLAQCQIHLIFLDLIYLIIFNEQLVIIKRIFSGYQRWNLAKKHFSDDGDIDDP